ncbi:hypothetical protein DERP_009156 [Dermatophagoides pteronyssinus]|uniref:Uncharacterized protein n=1 Tax=Dermatophagoides pteronyssinus TaxID=6956 RepID=A0ABQ8JQQ0_DERPT|nr:hypothetical protein DERP_009156 [Dermatophagoides pteronyssinus]
MARLLQQPNPPVTGKRFDIQNVSNTDISCGLRCRSGMNGWNRVPPLCRISFESSSNAVLDGQYRIDFGNLMVRQDA